LYIHKEPAALHATELIFCNEKLVHCPIRGEGGGNAAFRYFGLRRDAEIVDGAVKADAAFNFALRFLVVGILAVLHPAADAFAQ